MAGPHGSAPEEPERVTEPAGSDRGDACNRRRLFFIVASLLFIVAGATLGVTVIGHAFADDGKVNHDFARWSIQTIQGVLIAAGVALFFARHALARLSSGGMLASCAVLCSGIGAGVGTWINVKELLPPPWESSGLTMPQRLALLAEAKKGFWGPTVEQARHDIPKGEGLDAAEGHYQVGYQLSIAGRFTEAADELKRTMAMVDKLPVPADPTLAAAQRELFNRAERELSGAYLRMGESANCVEHHTCDSCIFPVKDTGLHLEKTGSQLAMDVLKDLYERDPSDVTSKWLYNVAAMTLGIAPADLPANLRASPELFASEYPLPRFMDRAAAVGISDHRLAGGAILEDFDGDGDLDLVSSSASLTDGLRYYRNEGDGTFKDLSHEAGFDGLTHGLSISQGDFDNDGDPDISIVRGAWMRNFGTIPMSLLRNDGNGHFTDVTEKAGLMSYFPGQVAEWADYDNDGSIDLFIGHESTPEQKSPSFLYHNNKDGTFTDATSAMGVDPSGFVKGAAWGDFDNDGWVDLFVSRRTEPCLLYRNVAAPGGGRRFEDVTAKAGIEGALMSFAAWFFDFDNDGDLDLWSSTYSKNLPITRKDPYREPVAEVGPLMLQDGQDLGIAYCRLFRNNGDGTFTNVAKEMGLQRVALVMGSNFGDFDNDGWLDLYLGDGNPSYRALIPNKAFRNDHGKYFQDVTTATGLGHLQKGHAIAFGDVDGDGDQDVYADMGGFFPADTFANALYENPGNANHWVTLRLHGTQTNRRAVGARLKVSIETPSGPRDVFGTVGSSSSFGSNSMQQETGLGDATKIVAITVDWPVSRTQQVFRDVPLDRIVDLTEGDATPRVSEAKPFHLKSEGGECCPPAGKSGGD
jgi:hypothetical protein